jgi:hypothetical protein
MNGDLPTRKLRLYLALCNSLLRKARPAAVRFRAGLNSSGRPGFQLLSALEREVRCVVSSPSAGSGFLQGVGRTGRADGHRTGMAPKSIPAAAVETSEGFVRGAQDRATVRIPTRKAAGGRRSGPSTGLRHKAERQSRQHDPGLPHEVAPRSTCVSLGLVSQVMGFAEPFARNFVRAARPSLCPP